jgi:RHS repeat-associated protein
MHRGCDARRIPPGTDAVLPRRISAVVVISIRWRLVSQYALIGGIWIPGYYHFDGTGSTRAMTSSVGAETESYLYEAFGILLNSTGSPSTSFRFAANAGLYTDVSALMLNDQAYSPNIGRWQSSGVIDSSGALNFYQFLDNNPRILLAAGGPRGGFAAPPPRTLPTIRPPGGSLGPGPGTPGGARNPTLPNSNPRGAPGNGRNPGGSRGPGAQGNRTSGR